MGAMLENMNARLNEWMSVRVCRLLFAVRSGLKDKRGQGTTEYAILVGVLVVIAIIAVVAFRGKLQDLWNAISDGINSL